MGEAMLAHLQSALNSTTWTPYTPEDSGTSSTVNSWPPTPIVADNPQPTTTHTLQYDGPSDTVYIALHKGERLVVSPDMDTLIQRLLDEGHEFSPVD